MQDYKDWLINNFNYKLGGIYPTKRTIKSPDYQDEYGWTPAMFCILMGHKMFKEINGYIKDPAFQYPIITDMNIPIYMHHDPEILDDHDHTVAIIAFFRNHKIEEWMYCDPNLIYEPLPGDELFSGTLFDYAVKYNKKIPEHFILDINSIEKEIWYIEHYNKKSNYIETHEDEFLQYVIYNNKDIEKYKSYIENISINGWKYMKYVIEHDQNIKEYSKILKFDKNFIDEYSKTLAHYLKDVNKYPELICDFKLYPDIFKKNKIEINEEILNEIMKYVDNQFVIDLLCTDGNLIVDFEKLVIHESFPKLMYMFIKNNIKNIKNEKNLRLFLKYHVTENKDIIEKL